MEKGEKGNSATRQASAREDLSKAKPLASAVAMQDATTKAEEEDTPAAGGTVPLRAILRRRGGLCWEVERKKEMIYRGVEVVEGALVAALEVERPVVLGAHRRFGVDGERAGGELRILGVRGKEGENERTTL